MRSEPLKAVIASPANNIVLVAALETLVHWAHSEMTIDTAHHMDNPDERVRAAAIALASRVKNNNASVDPVAHGFDDQSPLVRISAIQVAIALHRTNLLDKLQQMLRDPDSLVRHEATQALASFGSQGNAIIRSIANGGVQANNHRWSAVNRQPVNFDAGELKEPNGIGGT